MKKYAFDLLKLKHLSYVVSKDSLKAVPAKFKAIQEWPQPINLREFQSFLGMANYYSKSLTSCANIAAPLYKLLHKDVKWNWSYKHIEGMHALQKALSSPPVLCLTRFSESFSTRDQCF